MDPRVKNRLVKEKLSASVIIFPVVEVPVYEEAKTSHFAPSQNPHEMPSKFAGVAPPVPYCPAEVQLTNKEAPAALPVLLIS